MKKKVSKIRKILLLNPPGEKCYIRDCYCSTEAKGRFYWHPLDLLVQSGYLANHFEVNVMDALALDLSLEEGYRKIIQTAPDAIFFVTGSLSWKSDLSLLEGIKNETGCLLIASGDLPRFTNGPLDGKWGIVDGIVKDFTSPDLVKFLLSGGREEFPDVVFPGNHGNSSGENRSMGKFDYPYPLHSSFPANKYRLPFISSNPFASVLTSYGCSYNCKFCNVKALPFKTRNLDGVEKELVRLKREENIESIFFRDPNIAAVRTHAAELAERIKKFPFKLHWNSYARIDCVDDDLAGLFAESGCNLLQFGLESGSDRILEATSKGFSTSLVDEKLKICKKHGIKTCGHFIFGLPGETREEMETTLDFALSLPLDYASFNIFEVRPGISDEFASDASDPTIVSRKLSLMKTKAVKKFYLRPSFMAKTLFYALTEKNGIKALAGNIREFFRMTTQYKQGSRFDGTE